MNNFVEKETDGKMRDIISAQQITDDLASLLVNAVHFKGAWEKPFSKFSTHNRTFRGFRGDRELLFMTRVEKELLVNLENEFGTALLIPYQGNEFQFFMIMPKEFLDFEKMRNDLTGEKINQILYYASPTFARVIFSIMKIGSDFDGVEVLKRLGVHKVFSDGADLSKLSDSRLAVSRIVHGATIEVS
ncbi:hypothetical protein PFISCL1PPCAC_5187, partial [Pristionchus fissidentatus]